MGQITALDLGFDGSRFARIANHDSPHGVRSLVQSLSSEMKQRSPGTDIASSVILEILYWLSPQHRGMFAHELGRNFGGTQYYLVRTYNPKLPITVPLVDKDGDIGLFLSDEEMLELDLEVKFRDVEKIDDRHFARVHANWVRRNDGRKVPNNFIIVVPSGRHIVEAGPSETWTYTVQIAETSTKETGREGYAEAYVGLEASADVRFVELKAGGKAGVKGYVKRAEIQSKSWSLSVTKSYEMQRLKRPVLVLHPPGIGASDRQDEYGWRIKHNDPDEIWPKSPLAAYWPLYNMQATPKKHSGWRLAKRKLDDLVVKYAAEKVQRSLHTW